MLARLQRHLQFLGLTYVATHLDELLAWSVRERPAHAAFLEHVLCSEVASKAVSRIERRVRNSGLLDERKTLEAFDFNFQPSIDKSFIL